MSKSTKLNVGQNGMVSSDGAKLFRIEGEHICFLDKKDKRRISDRGGVPEVKIPVRDMITLLSGQQPASPAQPAKGASNPTQAAAETAQLPAPAQSPSSGKGPLASQVNGQGPSPTPQTKGGQPTNENGTMENRIGEHGQPQSGHDSQVYPSLTNPAGADSNSSNGLGAEPRGNTGNVQTMPELSGESGGIDTPSPTG